MKRSNEAKEAGTGRRGTSSPLTKTSETPGAWLEPFRPSRSQGRWEQPELSRGSNRDIGRMTEDLHGCLHELPERRLARAARRRRNWCAGETRWILLLLAKKRQLHRSRICAMASGYFCTSSSSSTAAAAVSEVWLLLLEVYSCASTAKLLRHALESTATTLSTCTPCRICLCW